MRILVVLAGVVGLAAGGVAGLVWWSHESHAWAVPVPYLSFTYDEPIAPGVKSVGGLVLHAHSDVRQAQEEGFIVCVANASDKPVRFNTRPLRQGSGLGGRAQDTEGKQHPLMVEAMYPRGRHYNANAEDLLEVSTPLRGAEILALKPGARFSISITFHATDDPRHQLSRAVNETALRGPVYRVKNYTLSFSYVRENETPEDVWEGTLISNAFNCDQKPQPIQTPTRFRQASFPRDLFQVYYDRMRHYSREDAGRRLLLFQHFCLLEHYGILRPGQFDQVLDWAVIDDAPLMRLEAVRYPRTWKSLLLDADPDVRRGALFSAAKRNVYPSHVEIGEIVSAIYLYGNAGERLLAVETLSRHGVGDNPRSRVRWDIITKALADPDAAVRKQAQELFADFPPLVTVPF